MAEVALPLLGEESIAGNSINPSLRKVKDIGARSEAFAQALNRQNQAVDNIASSGATSPIAGASPPVGGIEAPSVADEQIRARRALDLDSSRATSVATSGDTILGGMKKLRGIFDIRNAQISRVQGSNLVDTQTLIEMQKEVVQYTMLLDITSKLTGKASQVVDQLMKGQ